MATALDSRSLELQKENLFRSYSVTTFEHFLKPSSGHLSLYLQGV